MSGLFTRQGEQRLDEGVALVVGVVDSQRRAHGGFNAEVAQGGLGAMVVGAHVAAALVDLVAVKVGQIKVYSKENHSQLRQKLQPTRFGRELVLGQPGGVVELGGVTRAAVAQDRHDHLP